MSLLLLCGVMALFGGLASVHAHDAQGDGLRGPATQTTVNQDWLAAPAIHAILTAPDDDSLEQEDDDDPDSDGRDVALDKVGSANIDQRTLRHRTSVAALAGHADGQWLRAP